MPHLSLEQLVDRLLGKLDDVQNDVSGVKDMVTHLQGDVATLRVQREADVETRETVQEWTREFGSAERLGMRLDKLENTITARLDKLEEKVEGNTTARWKIAGLLGGGSLLGVGGMQLMQLLGGQ